MVYGSWFLIGLWVVVFGSWFMSPVQATSTPLPEDATGTVEPPENKINPILVTLQVIIPGFDPSDVIVIGNGENGCKLGYTCVRTITNYLNAIYKWGVGAGAIFAIVLIMIGGVEWMIGSAVGTIERAKTRIKNASLGLLLLLGTTVILRFINPGITALTTLDLRGVERAEPDVSTESITGGDRAAVLPSSITAPSSTASASTTPSTAATIGAAGIARATDIAPTSTLTFGSGVEVSAAILPILEQTATRLRGLTQGAYALYVADGLRSPEEQAGLWIKHCFNSVQDRSASFSCNPLTCNPFPRDATTAPVTTTGTMSSGPFKIKSALLSTYDSNEELTQYLLDTATSNTKQYCPHSLGTTVDVWCAPRTGSYADNVECHLLLDKEMRASGFKRIATEPWHFEYAGDGAVPPSQQARSGSWTDGNMIVTSKYCQRGDRHGSNCEFDYATCSDLQGGTGYANMKKGCCSNKEGVCVD